MDSTIAKLHGKPTWSRQTRASANAYATYAKCMEAFTRDVKSLVKFLVVLFFGKQKKSYSMKAGASSLLIPDKTLLKQGKVPWLRLPCCWGLAEIEKIQQVPPRLQT